MMDFHIGLWNIVQRIKNQEKIHEDAKDFFNHELDEKYCERYKIQKFSCDTVFDEDYCRVRKDNSPQNLSFSNNQYIHQLSSQSYMTFMSPK